MLTYKSASMLKFLFAIPNKVHLQYRSTSMAKFLFAFPNKVQRHSVEYIFCQLKCEYLPSDVAPTIYVERCARSSMVYCFNNIIMKQLHLTRSHEHATLAFVLFIQCFSKIDPNPHNNARGIH
jgi:hypothetical protein